MTWRIYYWSPDKGSFIVTSDEKTWNKAPKTGVQVVMHHNGYGWTLSHGQDEPYLIPTETITKLGGLAPDSEFNRILEDAYAFAGVVRKDL